MGYLCSFTIMIKQKLYRLRHHETQLRADRWATYGGLAGLSSTLITGVPLVTFVMPFEN